MDNNEFSSVAPAPVKKHSCKGKIAVAAIVAALVGGGVASGVFLIAKPFSGQADSRENNCEQNKIEDIAIEPAKDENGTEIANKGTILDAQLIHRLAYKTNRIFSGVMSSERYVESADTDGDISRLKNISDSFKVNRLLTTYFFNDRETINVDQLPDSSSDKKDYKNNGQTTVDITRITDIVKSDYKDLYGTDMPSNLPETITSDFLTMSCGANYAKDAGYYVHYFGCGGGTTIGYRSYQYKYELDGNKAYVYLALSRVDEAYSNSPTVTNDWASGSTVVANGHAWGIDKDDYKLYKHYRAVFEKGENGDFNYKTVEQVND